MRNEAVNPSRIKVRGQHFNLIPSRFPPVNLFERIGQGDGNDVAEIEALTNPRLRERERLIGTRATDVASARLQNWNHAAFAYGNPEGSRFFPPTIPVLELAADLQTALSISVARREAFLARTAESAIMLDMRVLVRTVEGTFSDLRSLPLDMPTEERWKLGRELAETDCAGVIFECPERPGASCVAVLDPDSLGRATQSEHFRYVWNGQKIEALYSFADGLTIIPDELRSAKSVRAA
ncbi:RES family NAD+ phosphorylase [Enterovirga sp. CN4-39]|uniref:RES family NAD+ phosphorylase n=1 Tax=Enterovirga sp. CN4-39 TaxID=3400910 RepID=UPI003C0CE73D